MKRYEDDHLYYIRKPHGKPTTFGSQFSFVEELPYLCPDLYALLEKEWTREEERGLLNRLDNDTAGLLYFAKTKKAAEWYYEKQDLGEVAKRYLCDVQGKMERFSNTDTHVMWTDCPYSNEQALCVSYPLMHHAYDEQKMIVVRSQKDIQKGRSKQHQVKTYFIPLSYDEETDTTMAYAVITKGIRHQIRAHAAGIGYALLGDAIYKGIPDDHLHLWSVGLTIA